MNLQLRSAALLSLRPNDVNSIGELQLKFRKILSSQAFSFGRGAIRISVGKECPTGVAAVGMRPIYITSALKAQCFRASTRNPTMVFSPNALAASNRCSPRRGQSARRRLAPGSGFLALIEHTRSDFVHALLFQSRAPHDRYVDVRDRKGFRLQHSHPELVRRRLRGSCRAVARPRPPPVERSLLAQRLQGSASRTSCRVATPP